MLRPFGEDVLAHPAAHATMAFMWAPEVRPEIERRLPKAMQSEQIRRQVDWERRHDQVTNDQAMPVPAETPAAKRVRHCRERGICLCRSVWRPHRLCLEMWRSSLATLLRKPTVTLRALRGENEDRVAADAGQIIIKFSHTVTAACVGWGHLSYLRHKPLRPVFMRLTASSGGSSSGGADPAAEESTEEVLTPMWANEASGAPQHRWWWCTDEEFILPFDLEHPVSFHLFQLTEAWKDDSGFVRLRARPRVRGVRNFWPGLLSVQSRLDALARCDVDEEEAEQAGREEEGDAANDDDDEEDEEHEPEGERDAGPLQAPEPLVGSVPGEDHPPPPKRRQRSTGSDLAWVRPLVPGHRSTHSVLPEGVDICTLSRITRSATGATSWVARYAGTAVVLRPRVWPPGARMHQKTRSMTYEDGLGEHDAFRETLFWLWRRHAVHLPRDSPDGLPPHVTRALHPKNVGKLLPCPACLSGTCRFMEEAAGWLGQFNLEEVAESPARARAPVVTSVPPVLVPAEIPARPPMQAKGVVPSGPPLQPPRPHGARGLCIACGAADGRVQANFFVCDFCLAIDGSLSAKEAPAHQFARRVLASLTLEPSGRDASHGPGWRRIPVPPDGDCLFSSVAVCKMLLDGHPVPPLTDLARWGQSCRNNYLRHAQQRSGDTCFGVASMAELVRASTDLTLNAYLARMQRPSAADRRTWGGFLEVAILCRRWGCRAHFFKVEDRQQLVLMSSVGEGPVRNGYKRHGQCAVVWLGAHYEALDLSSELTLQLSRC